MRISLFGGPGTGKSVTAAKVFVELRTKGHNIELCHEYVKNWAYENKVPKSFDQYYIFGKQLHIEDVLLSNGVEHIVSDSPLMLQLVYMKRFFDVSPLISIIKEFDKKYPPLNIFLSREGIEYKQIGRWQDEAGAIEIDNQIKDLLDFNSVPYNVVRTLDFDLLMRIIENAISIDKIHKVPKF